MSGTVFVVDRVVTKPGRAREFVDRYRNQYVPGGRARGMTLEHILVSPPIWQTDSPNTVTVTWTVPDVDGWWNMVRLGRRDPAVIDWWEQAADLIVDRSRSMAATADDVEGLCDV